MKEIVKRCELCEGIIKGKHYMIAQQSYVSLTHEDEHARRYYHYRCFDEMNEDAFEKFKSVRNARVGGY
jgi:hypothetical protein